jgi:rhamnosyltransferase
MLFDGAIRPASLEATQEAGAMADSLDASVIIPTRQAESYLPQLLARLADTEPPPRRVLFIDSASTDRTQELVRQAGYDLEIIDPATFGHGRTRNLALRLCADTRFAVFLTQDAVPVGPDWLVRLLAAFSRPDVAVSYGRQLSRPNATLPERFAREFNYPATDEITTEADIARRGIKAVFCSNSFAAYDRARLLSVGGFPEDLPMGEDMAATLRLLRRGFARAYCATATAVHSHSYSIGEEFRRYFDIGVLLDCDPELQRARLSASNEGQSMVKAELREAWAQGGAAAAADVVARASGKLIGFYLGRKYRLFPRSVCRRLSLHSYYWQPS